MNNIRLFKTLYRVFIAVAIVGTLFRIQHWPYGREIVIVGVVCFAISFVRYMSLKLEKSYLDRIGMVVVPLWCAYYLMGLLRVPNRREYSTVLAIVAIAYSLYQVFMLYRSEKKEGINNVNWERIFYISGAAFVVIGVFLKIQYWPYAYPILIAGGCSMLLSFLMAMFAKPKKD